VPGEVVAAAFGVFKPAAVVKAIDEAWTKTDPATILSARERGAIASLRRIIGSAPARAEIEGGMAEVTGLLLDSAAAAPPGEGRALYSGLTSLGVPDDPVGALWRACDLVREHRGDSHIIAWVSHGLDPVQATLMTELWWRLPLGSYVKTRFWSPEEIEAAVDDLRHRGLVAGDEFTANGEQLRADIECCTDRQERPIVAALGDRAERAFTLLTPLTDAVVDAKGYPADPRHLSRR
jgi:hypothetical protein